MKTCELCNKHFPNHMEIDGKLRNLSSRKRCIECTPFNTKPKFVPTKRWEIVPSIIDKCLSYSDIIRAVGLDDRGNNHITAKKVVEYYKLNIDHFKRRGGGHKKLSFDEIFCKDSKANQNLVSKKFKEFTKHKCTICDITKWNDKPIVLQLDHINGDRRDNKIENLRLVCPNCHSQTETWGRKTKDYDPMDPRPIQTKICSNTGCNNTINQQMKYCSKECAYEGQRKIKRPSKEQLIVDVNNMSFRKVAKKYEVSDKTVRKWLIYYSIDLQKSYSGKTIIEDQS